MTCKYVSLWYYCFDMCLSYFYNLKISHEIWMFTLDIDIYYENYIWVAYINNIDIILNLLLFNLHVTLGYVRVELYKGDM